MSDEKITELTELTSPSTVDLLPIIKNPSGTPTTEKVALASVDTLFSATSKTLTNKTLTGATLTSPVINTGVSGTAVLDEDDMASDSNTKVATQQSIKAYSDSATQTLTNKTLTAPVINGAITGDAIATGATIITGTANDDIVTSKAIKDANILTQAWTAWTPVFSAGVTKGDGVTAGQYTRSGNLVIARWSFVLGSTSAITGNVQLTLPVASVSYTGTSGFPPIGHIHYLDTGTALYAGAVVWTNTTTCTLNTQAAGGTYVSTTALSSSIPFTWADTNEMGGLLIYEAA